MQRTYKHFIKVIAKKCELVFLTRNKIISKLGKALLSLLRTLIHSIMKSQVILLAIILASTFMGNPANSQTLKSQSQLVTDSILFNTLVARYTQSIDQADTVLASEVWSHTDEVSFINPRGNEYGWNGVKNIYTMFHNNFSTRKLSFLDLKYADYGDVAWLEFYWVFDATLKMNNNPVQTKGRETQIWRKVNDEWRLVHVHYSGMPITGQGQGF
jgi:hypothetical protein